MSTGADLIRQLRVRGVAAETILDAVLAVEDERLAKGRARTAKWRKNKEGRDECDVTSVTGVTHVTRARVEGSSSSKEDTGKKESNTGARKGAEVAALRAELETVLDPEHAAAVVEHRQRMPKDKQLTVRAAKALAGKFAQCPDPNAAADTMLANGWRGIDPTWLPSGKTNGKTDGPVLYKFSTVEEVMAEIERERKANGVG